MLVAWRRPRDDVDRLVAGLGDRRLDLVYGEQLVLEAGEEPFRGEVDRRRLDARQLFDRPLRGLGAGGFSLSQLRCENLFVALRRKFTRRHGDHSGK